MHADPDAALSSPRVSLLAPNPPPRRRAAEPRLRPREDAPGGSGESPRLRPRGRRVHGCPAPARPGGDAKPRVANAPPPSLFCKLLVNDQQTSRDGQASRDAPVCSGWPGRTDGRTAAPRRPPAPRPQRPRPLARTPSGPAERAASPARATAWSRGGRPREVQPRGRCLGAGLRAEAGDSRVVRGRDPVSPAQRREQCDPATPHHPSKAVTPGTTGTGKPGRRSPSAGCSGRRPGRAYRV